MKAFAAIMMVAAMADAKRRNAWRKRVTGAEIVNATCMAKSDDEMSGVKMSAFGWEADGSGDAISPDWIASKVAAMEVNYKGSVMGNTVELFGYIETACDAAFDMTTEDAEFSVPASTTWMGSYFDGKLMLEASDLIDASMVLNLRDDAGASSICCVFDEIYSFKDQ